MIISFVWSGPNGLADQVNLLKKIDEVKVFNLITNEEILKKRHTNDSYKREGIEKSIRLNESIRNIQDGETIDNSEMTIEETVKVIKDKIS